MPPASAIAAPPQEIERAPDDVLAFSRQRKITRELATAIDLAQRHFPLAQPPVLELLGDPDGAEEWILIKIRVPCDLSREELFDRYDSYTDAVLSALPARASEIIRVSIRKG